jgi:uncharacterized Zn-binding protein involved in type VI secretion
MPPAARITDMHVCPMVTGIVPHVGGPILPPCEPTVLIGFLPAARVTDMLTCVGPPDIIVMGSPTVLIGGLMAARIGDPTAHGGVIVLGCFTVIIGDVGMGVASPPAASAMPRPPQAAPAPAAAGAAIPKECSYLDKPYTVESSKANFDRIRKDSKLGKPKDIKHKFPGDKAEQDALEYEVDVDGHKKKLIMPKNPPKGKNIPTAEQLVASMGTVPPSQLDQIPEVVASPNPNPDDAYWAKQYKIPNFSSAATGGSSALTFYPTTNAWTQEFTDSTMIHEGGHTYSGKLWSDDAKKKAWEKAISDDKRAPSKYAGSSSSEDFSESLVMYSLSKGTPCEATAKKLYPSRYKALDDLFGAKSK